MKDDMPDQAADWVPADVVCLGLTGSGPDLGPSAMRVISADVTVDGKVTRRRGMRASADRDGSEGDAG
jgi:hypothetical protein